jgi:Xaa-Pro aminopeptidase
VGFFLNVHEGPQGFSPVPNTPRANTTLEPGMLTSIEPGLYKEGQYGIRIENLVLCKEAGKTEFGEFLEFEAVTLFPIELDLVDADLLSKEEIEWLNKYHEKVYREVAPLLTTEEQAWLKHKCRSL